MKRAVERYLGRPAVKTPGMEDESQPPLETVVFAVAVRRRLVRQLDVKGQWQGGALFGELTLGTLTVRFVTPLGPPGWSKQPLLPHLPYLIGWSDSVDEQYSPALDWCGNWIAAPDSRLPDERADLSWLQLGAQQGLFDDAHPLVIVGLENGRLLGRAYSWDEDGPVALRGPLEVPMGL